MKLITQSRLFGILLVAAALPMDPGVALAASAASAVGWVSRFRLRPQFQSTTW